MLTSRGVYGCLAFPVLVAAVAAPCAASIVYGPQIVSINLTRTWFDGGGAVIVTDSALSGPLAYGPNTGPQTTPATAFASDSLSAPGQPAWQVAGRSRGILEQSGTSETMRAFAGVITETGISTAPSGHAAVSFVAVHNIDFQLTQPTLWLANLSTVLSSPIYPALLIIRDPGGAAATVVSESLSFTDSGLQRGLSGTLPAGSYRLSMSFPLSFDVPGGVPGYYGGVHTASINFAVPAPSAAALLGLLGPVAVRRRRA